MGLTICIWILLQQYAGFVTKMTVLTKTNYETTVKDYWPDKTEKKEERIVLANVASQKILIDTNEELAVLVKVPGLNEIGKGRTD